MHPDDDNVLTLLLASTFDQLEQAVTATQQFLMSQNVGGEVANNVVLLISEAITNAMEHGNGWEATKHVELSIVRKVGCIEAAVTDEGEGFEEDRVENPFEPHNMFKGGGRGVFLMRELADDVQYDRGGRRVRMVFNVPD